MSGRWASISWAVRRPRSEARWARTEGGIGSLSETGRKRGVDEGVAWVGAVELWELDGGNAVLIGQGGANRVIREEDERAGFVAERSGLRLRSEDGGHGRGDSDGDAELEVEASCDIHAVPAEVGRVDLAFFVDGAGGGHADGNECAVDTGGEPVDASDDVLDEVIGAELRDRGGNVVFADNAAAGVVEADIRRGGADRDAGKEPAVIGGLERNRGAAATLGAGEVRALLDEAGLEESGGGAGDGGLGQSGGLHELAARDDGIEAYEVEALSRRGAGTGEDWSGCTHGYK